jgi:nucleotide-binding universal stress UspA family protein
MCDTGTRYLGIGHLCGDVNVLIGIDGSDTAIRALEDTVQRVTQTGDELTVAIVETPTLDLSVDTIEQQVRDVLDTIDDPVNVLIQVLMGQAGPQLAQFADAEGFDQLIISNHACSPTGKITFGETTEFILLNAETSVLLHR